jgi:signal transduction histidine kinase
VQEALTNAVRHAKASAIRLSMRVERDHVVLAVVDARRVASRRARTAQIARPHGLLAMRERAIALGGTAANRERSWRSRHRSAGNGSSRENTVAVTDP